MSARELLTMISVKLDRSTGRKARVRTTDRRCKPFVAAHQALLRRYFRDPNSEVLLVHLMASASTEDLTRLGFEPFEDANNKMFWCHPEGDGQGIRLLVGLVSDIEIHERRRRMQREQHALGRAS